MKRETQAYVAYCAEQLAADGTASSLRDKDRQEAIQARAGDSGLVLKKYPARKECPTARSHDGNNHCIVDNAKDHHVCLSVYGRLFDGYDHGSSSHFSGMVNDDAVELYDFSKSDFFRFEKD